MPLPPPSNDFPPERLIGLDTTKEYILGIDEAGRGPVLGPLVYALFLIPADSQPKLAALEPADSKELSVNDRQSFFNKCLQIDGMHWITRVLSPMEISEAMLRLHKYNLNELSYDAVYELLDRVVKLIKIKHLFVDTLGKPESYKERLIKRFPLHLNPANVTVSPKADSIYPIVSAASIIAKVTRDYSLNNWIFDRPITNRNFGCGYPSDPLTVKWLAENVDRFWGFPDIVRFSWSSCERILNERAIKMAFSGDDLDGGKKRKAETSVHAKGYIALSGSRIINSFT